jgi:argininosuccinate synthase
VHYSWEKPNIRLTKDFGTSVGGKETLTSNQPLPSDAYPSQLQKKEKKKLRYNLKKN